TESCAERSCFRRPKKIRVRCAFARPFSHETIADGKTSADGPPQGGCVGGARRKQPRTIVRTRHDTGLSANCLSEEQLMARSRRNRNSCPRPAPYKGKKIGREPKLCLLSAVRAHNVSLFQNSLVTLRRPNTRRRIARLPRAAAGAVRRRLPKD